MENQLVLEAVEILKKLSPQNQAYLMTMARVAEEAEKNVKASMRKSTPAPRADHPESEAKNQCALF